MLKSISCWALRGQKSRPAEELFAEVREHGFDAIELTVGTEGLLTPDSSEGSCRTLVEKARAAGIEVSSLASGLGWQFPLSSDDEEVRRKGIDIMGKCLRMGGWLGIETLLVVPGTLSSIGSAGSDHVPYDVCYQRMQEGIERLIETAEEAHVNIGVENVWNKVLLSPLEMRDFIDSFDSERVSAYFDVGNVIVMGYAEDWIKILGSRITSVHFKDFKRDVGTLKGFCDLLEGDVNYPAAMEGLRSVGYDGPCVAEFFELGAEALSKVSEAMDRIFAM